MRAEAGQVLHFSEDPAITEFVPRAVATSQQRSTCVWAVDEDQAPAYWFPRQCPRVTAWVTAGSTGADASRIIGPGGGRRVHAIEYRWLDRMRTVQLFAYRLPATDFAPVDAPDPYAHISARTVKPLGSPEPVGDLLALHEAAGIQLRLLPRAA